MKKILIGILSATLVVILSTTASAVSVSIDGKLNESVWSSAEHSIVLQSPSAGVQFADFYYFLSGNDFYFGANWVDEGSGSGAGGIQIYFADGFGPALRPNVTYNGELNLTHKIVVQRGTDYTLEGRLTLPDNQMANLSQIAVCIIGKSGGITPRGYISTGITAPSPTTTMSANSGGGIQTTTRVPSGGSGGQTTTKASHQGGGSVGQAVGGNTEDNNSGGGSHTGEDTAAANNGDEIMSNAQGEKESEDVLEDKNNQLTNPTIAVIIMAVVFIIAGVGGGAYFLRQKTTPKTTPMK